jgi:hypothetical protein
MKDKRSAGFFHLFTILGVIFLAIIVIFAWQYFAGRPNYRDLEKEYKLISANIPSDWTLVSQSSNKGLFGLFCLQIEGSECPHIIYEYRVGSPLADPLQMLSVTKDVVLSSGLSYLSDTFKKCEEPDVSSRNFTCSSGGHSGGVFANVSLTNKNSAGEDGQWAFISISRYAK